MAAKRLWMTEFERLLLNGVETVSYLEVLDMMSGEEDRENILRARATSNVVLTNPFRFLELNHLGVVLTLPVYRMGLPAEAIEVEHIQAPAE
ncbi:hypothetical protein HPP92_006532 [Vanilla planifolia]|uniref:CHASE domain-containing protein n=1 Tax=Vanilla planifolia TaxID=51239 RepID=A0A835VA35_VANPL|nr:hypothetical protein HPP92_006532 [Vanilla planifolia]